MSVKFSSERKEKDSVVAADGKEKTRREGAVEKRELEEKELLMERRKPE
jgi:hypothetical protein